MNINKWMIIQLELILIKEGNNIVNNIKEKIKEYK